MHRRLFALLRDWLAAGVVLNACLADVCLLACMQLEAAHGVTTTAELAELKEDLLAECFAGLELKVPTEAAQLCLAWLKA